MRKIRFQLHEISYTFHRPQIQNSRSLKWFFPCLLGAFDTCIHEKSRCGITSLSYLLFVNLATRFHYIFSSFHLYWSGINQPDVSCEQSKYKSFSANKKLYYSYVVRRCTLQIREDLYLICCFCPFVLQSNTESCHDSYYTSRERGQAVNCVTRNTRARVQV